MPSKQERCRSTFFLVSLECFRKKLEPRRCIRVSSLARKIHARLVHAGWCLKVKGGLQGGHTSFFMRTTHLPSCFGIPRPSCAPWLFLHALSHLFLHSRHTSSICLFHLPLPPTSKNFQRRFITVASSASSICLFHRHQRASNVASSLPLLHCHNVTALSRCNVASEASYYLLRTQLGACRKLNKY